jgi:hypothetical protein
MGADGTCPTCGRVLAAAGAGRPARPVGDERPFAPPPGDEVATKVPWHFWVLVAAVVAYLGWRVVQMISWVVT